MFRAASLGTVVGVIALACAFGGRATPPSAPAYIDKAITTFAIYTNDAWQLPGAHASQIAVAPRTGREMPGGDQHWYIWAPTCTSGAQIVSFSRSIFLPGPPVSLDLAATTIGTSARSIVLSANGHLLARSGSYPLGSGDTVPTGPTRDGSIQYHTLQLDPKASPFHYGLNKLDLVVTKSAEAGAAARCGAGSPTRFGVQLTLEGSGFPTALRVGGPGPSEANVATNVTPGQNKRFSYLIHLYNDGPSATLGTSFAFDIQTGSEKLAGPVRASVDRGFRSCTQSGTFHIFVTCPSAGWFAPGAVSEATIIFDLAIRTDEGNGFVDDATFGWALTPLPSTNQPEHNTSGQAVVLCWPGASDPRCANAK